MQKYSFFDDYSEGCHPKILELLLKSNLDQETGYGNDSYTAKAKEIIKEVVGNKDADVYFVSGGTQANLICLSSMLKSYESVITANTAHINIHEAGAIEATGHKINIIETSDGKLTARKIQDVVDFHTDEHMVRPKVVSISNPTEVGTVYKKVELENIAKACEKNGLYLYLDGARLGSALVSRESDITLKEISKLVDIFYIGGTKGGALLGEAILINNSELKPHFRHQLKQRGALLAKGRVLGIQFIGLYSDDLYLKLAKHANAMAEKLTKAFQEAGYEFLANSTTNQIFPILPNSLIEKLQQKYGFYEWVKIDAERSAIRLVTSWATLEDKVDEFIVALKGI